MQARFQAAQCRGKQTSLRERQANPLSLASNIIPSLRDPAWAFLGYDVCDKWLLSGLSNCGYGTNEAEIQLLRDTYASDLNEHHLFDSIELATEFRRLSDERVQEHAPFFVFGIWLINKEESPGHPERDKNDLV